MQELIEAHLATLTHHQKATQRARRVALQGFSRYCQEQDLSLPSLQRSHLQAYQQLLTWTPGARGLPSASTIVQVSLMVRTFLSWVYARKGLAGDFLKEWTLGKPSFRTVRLLGREQMEAIFEAPDPVAALGLRNRALLSVICQLGLYGKACAALNLADVDWVKYRLRERNMGPDLTEKLMRYSKKGRPALLACPDEPALFLSQMGRRLSVISISKMLQACAGAGDVGPRLLHRSWQAQRQAFQDRRMPEF